MTWLAAVGLGLGMGLQHALEPDHVTAVTTLAREERSAWVSARTGAVWGVGHSASLIGLSFLVLFLRLPIPADWLSLVDLPVGLMLVVLGLLALRNLGRQQGHLHLMRQGGRWRVLYHSHGSSQGQGPEPGAAGRPLLAGLLQGLAGSGALIVFMPVTFPSTWMAFAFVVAFAAATVLTMAACTWLITLPLRLTTGRWRGLNLGLQGMVSLLSVGVGVSMVWSIATGQ